MAATQSEQVIIHEAVPELATLFAVPINIPLPLEITKSLIQQPPFLPLPNALNLRTVPLPATSKLKIYRSGQLHHLSPESLSLLHTKYGVTKVFDLRSKKERVVLPSPVVEGIETVWNANVEDDDNTREVKLVPIARFAEGEGELKGLEAWKERNTNVLTTYGKVYRPVFEWIRDNESGHESILFHCAAGKDRTGMLSALILGLASSTPENIAMDYELSRVGIESHRETLFMQLAQGMKVAEEDVFKTPGLVEMCESKGPIKIAFLDSLNETWGGGLQGKWRGVEGWLIKELGFSENETKKMKQNLGAFDNSQ